MESYARKAMFLCVLFNEKRNNNHLKTWRDYTIEVWKWTSQVAACDIMMVWTYLVSCNNRRFLLYYHSNYAKKWIICAVRSCIVLFNVNECLPKYCDHHLIVDWAIVSFLGACSFNQPHSIDFLLSTVLTCLLLNENSLQL